uniref:Immunoglobulin V-set domain-containing protein n=1 Tax=Salvator merianae TaxID=96440 RepID=A0A8D0B9S2_SALMN
MQDFRSREFFGNRFLLAAGLLGFWIPLIQAAVRNVPIVSIPETPAEGQDVLLTLEDVTNNFQKIDWYRGRTTDGTSRIFTYFPSYMKEQQRNGAEYTGREMGFPNGSLLITNVQPRDNKQYTVEVVLQFGGALKGTTDLVVAGPGTRKPSTSSNVQTNPTKEAPQVSLMLGWVAAGAVAGVLLAGAIGATLVYRSILHKGKPGTGFLLAPLLRWNQITWSCFAGQDQFTLKSKGDSWLGRYFAFCLPSHQYLPPHFVESLILKIANIVH